MGKKDVIGGFITQGGDSSGVVVSAGDRTISGDRTGIAKDGSCVKPKGTDG